MVCLWLRGNETHGDEVHHVFGRGTSADSIKEAYTSLMTVCRNCHPSPILVPPTQVWQAEVLQVWHNMNVSPRGPIKFQDGHEVRNPVGLRIFKVTEPVIEYWSL